MGLFFLYRLPYEIWCDQSTCEDAVRDLQEMKPMCVSEVCGTASQILVLSLVSVNSVLLFLQ